MSEQNWCVITQVCPLTDKLVLYLIRGFDAATLSYHTPDPGLFRTEEEAARWCEKHSSGRCIYGYEAVRIGRMPDA